MPPPLVWRRRWPPRFHRTPLAAGAAGMHAFENEGGLGSYLSTYAFAMFGDTTTAIASFFIGHGAEDEEAELAGPITYGNSRVRSPARAPRFVRSRTG